MTRLVLRGCRLEPLASYLKALGVLRLVGEQADADATGAWHGDTFVLESRLDGDSLVDFFATRYEPTPLVSPWNNASGLHADDQGVYRDAVCAIEQSTDRRLETYRQTIAVARVCRAGIDLRSVPKAKREAVKRSIVVRCRSRFPDVAVPWVDASVVLTAEDRAFAPLLGTGGNDGKNEFANVFMRSVAQVLGVDPSPPPPPPPERREAWLRRALFGSSDVALVEVLVGQFDPGGAGGVNSSWSGAAASLGNPWDFVFVLEGALLFASAAARRMGTGARGRGSVPFTVAASAVGFPTAAEGEESRGELWMPAWARPATIAEVARVIGEGRTEWAGHQAGTGLDAARAVATLGVDRGIDRFVRYGLVQRFGLNFLAVPIGRIDVRSRPRVGLTAALDPWVRPRQVDKLPAGARAALGRLHQALFDLATRPANATRLLQAVLVAAAELEAEASRSSKTRESLGRPLSGLDPREWLDSLDDRSPELRLAAAIASGRDRAPAAVSGAGDERMRSMATMLRPVVLDRSRRLSWSADPAPVPALGRRPLATVLHDALRMRAQHRADLGGEAGARLGVVPTFELGVAAHLPDVASLLAGEVDLSRLEALVRALLLLEWHRWSVTGPPRLGPPPAATGPSTVLHPLAAAVLLGLQGGAGRVEGREGPVDVVLRAESSWPALLTRNGVGRDGGLPARARRRLAIAGARPAASSYGPGPAELAERLAIAAWCRLLPASHQRLFDLLSPHNPEAS